MLDEFKLVMNLDLPSAQATSKDTARRESVPQIFTGIVPEYVAEIKKFCSNPDYKASFLAAVKSIKFKYEHFDDNKPRARYVLGADGELQILLNMSWLSYSVNADELSKWMEGNLGSNEAQSPTETKTGGEEDLTGFTLGEKKQIKDSIKEFGTGAKDTFGKYGIEYTIDWQSFQGKTKGTPRRDNLPWICKDMVKEYADEFNRWASGNEDFKEAMMENVKTVKFNCDCFDDNKPRANFALANKVFTINQNGSWIGYSVNPAEATAFLEKSL